MPHAYMIEIKTEDCEGDDCYIQEVQFSEGAEIAALIDAIHGIDTFYGHLGVQSIYIYLKE